MGCINSKARVQTVISVKPTITKNTSVFQTPRVSTKETTVGARNKIIGKQKSNRIGTTRETSILQQNVSGTKIRGSVAPDNRFVNFEQISPYPQFSYGNSRVHSGGNPTSRLDNFNRFVGCLPAHSHSQGSQEVSNICPSKPNLAVQGTSLWPVPCPVDIYTGSGRGQENGTKSKLNHAPISGRLAGEVPIQGITSGTDAMATGSMRISGPTSKPSEIRVTPNKRFRICGLQVQNRDTQGISHRETYPGHSRKGETILKNESQYSTGLDVHAGFINFSRKGSSHGSVTPERAAILSQKSVEPSSRNNPEISAIDRNGTVISELVGERGKPSTRFSNSSTQTSVSGIYRCINPGLGCTHGYEDNIWEVDPKTGRNAHKQSRIVSSPPSLTTLGIKPGKQYCANCHRQLHCCCICEQTGRNNFQIPRIGNKDTVVMGRPKEHSNQSQAHSRQAECTGGLPVQRGTGHNNRMVPFSSNISGTVQAVYETLDRPVCHKVELQNTKLCVSNSRSTSMGSGCIVHVLDRNVGICISPNINSDSSSKQGNIRQLSDNVDSPSIQQCTLVPSVAKSLNRRTSGVATNKKHVKTTKVKHVSPLPRIPQTSRLDIIRRSVKAKGFSEQASRCITEPVRSSTSAIYQSKWKIFTDWCSARKIDSVKATVQQVADFLLEKQEGGLALSTLEGYRTAISSTLKHTSGFDLSTNELLSALLKNFKQTNLRTRNPAPQWSLTLVLETLRGPPFEPMEKAAIKWVTLKTVFLVALASGKRRSELHAIERKGISWPANKESITFRVTPSFVAKTQIAADVRSIKPFKIRALNEFLSQGMEDDLRLCPVRAAFIYLDRTKQLGLHTDKKLFFVSYKKGHKKDIAKATISGWLKKTIKLAYVQATDVELRNNKVKVHQVRAMASSTAFYNNIPISEVMETCTWACHNTFTSFYLNDMSEQMEELYRLGPFIANQSVIHGSKG